MSAFELRDVSPFPAPQRLPNQIGVPGHPIRVISFAGSGFDTAMQLGVVHALLVTRASSPDVVIGASAGAISAVALAEVLQAGDIDDPGPRVGRFRELFEAYRRAPGEIIQSLGPDPAQVDTQRPLETLKVPVQHGLERRDRANAVGSRAGLINLYNTLLNIRLTVGTIARGMRCWLGYRNAAEIRFKWARRAARFGEIFRAWVLVGSNLHRVAALLPPVIRASLGGRRREEGATAAELIFASSGWRDLWRRLVEAFWTLVLIVLWLGLSAIAAALIIIVGTNVLLLAGAWIRLPGPAGLAPLAFVVGAVGVSAAYILLTRTARWQMVLSVLASLVRIVWLMAAWGLALAASVGIPLLLEVLVTRRWPPDYQARYWIIPLVLLALVGGAAVWRVAYLGRQLGQRVLSLFDLHQGLLDSDTLREFLVRMFNPELYKTDNIDRTIERALHDDDSPHWGKLGAKLVGEYAYTDAPSPRVYSPRIRDTPNPTKRPLPIHVAIAVVDVASGQPTTVPTYVHLVTALQAALAKPPFFRPVSVYGRLLVDATTVTNEPNAALLGLLRNSGLVEREATAVHLYSVAPLPLGQRSLGPELDRAGKPQLYTRFLDVLWRVLQLRRFRDATLERRLIALHTRAMSRPGKVFFRAEGRDFLRTWVYPIEPDKPLRVNYLTLQADTEVDRRQTIAETVADGCRAALQMMIQPAIDAEAPDAPAGQDRVTRCRAAVARHFADQNLNLPDLPGSTRLQPNSGPGIAEVCEHCALNRPHKSAPPSETPPDPQHRSLVAHARRPSAPPWPSQEAGRHEWVEPPHEWEVPTEKTTGDYPRALANLRRIWEGVWPVARPNTTNPDERPTVSLLFSGGVFRGVFQVGVLNGISEVSLRPDIVAGASVGSITAAMAARAFITPGLKGRDALAPRQTFIRRLAAAYLAIDRLILTNRFADFVRGFTVRAAQARFSIRDADRVIRRFDAANPWTFSREVRRVLAGFERLAYVSPFELRDLVEAFRRGRFGTAAGLLQDYFQELLERANVGQEILGAEPLERLINDYVLAGLTPPGVQPAHVTFQQFLNNGIFFFATATNLTAGRLDEWGAEQIGGVGTRNLLQALLTSSAFPGVFRRRWAWEASPTTNDLYEYADGGVMDNLPLDAVAQFLESVSEGRLIPRRPKVPHLILSASLETAPRPVTDPAILANLSQNWVRLLARTRELAYNRKVDLFGDTQDNLTSILRARDGNLDPEQEWTPLNIKVATIVPQWLCGTMAFHPMLGFRRSNEAESIAHGCASTLLALGQLASEPGGREKVEAWGVDVERLPNVAQARAVRPFVPVTPPKKTGNCWFRSDVVCPFSYAGQGLPAKGSHSRTAEELHAIYQACRDIKTHRPR